MPSQTGSEEPEWIVAQDASRRASRARLAGFWQAHLPIGAVALLILPIMEVCGEGDYILGVLAALWGGLGVYGLKLRRDSETGSARKSRGFFIALMSFILSALVAAMWVAFLIG